MSTGNVKNLSLEKYIHLVWQNFQHKTLIKLINPSLYIPRLNNLSCEI